MDVLRTLSDEMARQTHRQGLSRIGKAVTYPCTDQEVKTKVDIVRAQPSGTVFPILHDKLFHEHSKNGWEGGRSKSTGRKSRRIIVMATFAIY